MATAVEENMDLSQYKNGRHELSYSKLNEFRKGDIAWDVTLKSTDGDEIHAHKCVLASQSEYFERMFVGGFREATQDVIQMNNISSVILNNIIDFMYTGVLVKIEKNNVLRILNAADMFQMEDVRDKCIKYYMCLLHDSNCLEIKEIADTRAMTTLSEICLNHALKHFLLIAEYPSFLDADVTHLLQLLKDDNLNSPNEEPVYRAVMKWVQYDEIRRKHLLPDLLENIRLVFTSKDFVDQEVMTNPLVFSNPECYKIVKKVILHFNFKYGDSLSKIITNAKPRTNANRLTIDEMRRLRHYNCSKPPGYSKKGPINLLNYFNHYDSDHHFPQIEWNQYMNETNFLTRFSEVWYAIGDNETDDDDSDDEESDVC